MKQKNLFCGAIRMKKNPPKLFSPCSFFSSKQSTTEMLAAVSKVIDSYHYGNDDYHTYIHK